MTGFDAGKYVEPLAYDFTTATKPDGSGPCSGKGVTPEPSKQELEEYQNEVQRIFRTAVKHAPKTEDLSHDELIALMEQAEKDEDEGSQLLNELYELTVQISKGQPSREEIDELPGRIQQGYCMWLAKELTDPKYASGASAGSAANGAGSTTRLSGTSGTSPKR